MQIPCVGTQQGEDEDENTSPKEPKEEQELQNRPPSTKSSYSCAILQRLSESLKRTCNMYGVKVYFKEGNTIRSHLMALKDKDPMVKKSGVIYRYTCDRVECDEEYIGESSRTFGERFKEHQKVPSPIFDHYNTTGYKISLENFGIVGREDQNLMRTIKVALYIRVNKPSLNRNIGKYHLPHILG